MRHLGPVPREHSGNGLGPLIRILEWYGTGIGISSICVSDRLNAAKSGILTFINKLHKGKCNYNKWYELQN
jgi:hypothetical protein